mmetsp:Transcript_22458/g.51433  ORF Transcript_22458/g.51433 Transcript_22458/m.51433 type:complete len:349 (-) Transcript_22458:110-1156(-)
MRKINNPLQWGFLRSFVTLAIFPVGAAFAPSISANQRISRQAGFNKFKHLRRHPTNPLFSETENWTLRTAISNGNARSISPVSRSPLMYVVDDLLSSQECADAIDGLRPNCQPTPEGQAVKKKILQILDDILPGPPDMGRWLVRYIDYDTIESPEPDAPKAEELLPEGLHVDTNNSHLFRYVTALIYLSGEGDAGGGATVFPLALPIGVREADTDGLSAARTLLSNNVHHTRWTDAPADLAGILEGEAAKTFVCRGNSSSASGIRVVPKRGRICLFYTRTAESGEIDPRSYHGPEAVYDSFGKTKTVLTAFREIDRKYFDSFEEFSDCVKAGHLDGKEIKVPLLEHNV